MLQQAKLVVSIGVVCVLALSLGLIGCSEDSGNVTSPSLTQNIPQLNQNGSDAEQTARVNQQAQEFDEAVRLMEKHLQITSDGLFSLSDTSKTMKLPIEISFFEELKQSLEVTNSKILAGEIRSEEVYLSSDDSEGVEDHARGKYRGKNANRYYWWGFKFYRDYYRTKTIIRNYGSLCRYVPRCSIIYKLATRPYVEYLNNRWGRGIVWRSTWNGWGYTWHQ